MSLVEALEVPEPRSFCSQRQTFQPRPAASRAMPDPLMPPPIMARSKIAGDASMFSVCFPRRTAPPNRRFSPPVRAHEVNQPEHGERRHEKTNRNEQNEAAEGPVAGHLRVG